MTRGSKRPGSLSFQALGSLGLYRELGGSMEAHLTEVGKSDQAKIKTQNSALTRAQETLASP